jgi:hypothetical protein
MNARRMSGGRVSGRFLPNPGSDIGRCTPKSGQNTALYMERLELVWGCFDATLQGCNIAAGLCYHLEEGFRLPPNSNTDLFVDVILVKVKSSR